MLGGGGGGIIISIFQKDKVLSMNTSLQYVPPVNTDVNFYQIFCIIDLFQFLAHLSQRLTS